MALAEAVYKETSSFPKQEEYGLKTQMRRAAVSAPSNIAEGSQRGTDADFAYFIVIAKGSLAELATQTILASKFGYISAPNCKILLNDIDELQKMLYSFYQTLKAKG